MAGELSVGVDVGTQGVRVVCLDYDGSVRAHASSHWELRRSIDGMHEQDPATWWEAVLRGLDALFGQLTVAERDAVAAISATSTSGTLLILDGDGRPLRPALMWDDKRAEAEADVANQLLRDICEHNAYRIRPTFSLPKAMWVRGHEPDVFERTRCLAHAADWLTAQLGGLARPVTEPTNALKSGYDLLKQCWPDELADVGIAAELFPEVVPSGSVVGELRRDLAGRFGLTRQVVLAIGMTDANTALVSSGVVRTGAWTTGISTGLSVKGISPVQIRDGQGGLYCHHHGELGWIPSCTMHTGGDVLTKRFGDDRLSGLDRLAAERGPATVLTFPLVRRGEFFPIFAPDAEGFTLGRPLDEADAYRSCLEGVALMEALAYETCRALGAPVEGAVVTTGGGSHSDVWSQIRADVLGRPVCRPVQEGTALGAATVGLAALGDGLVATVERVVRHTPEIEPDRSTVDHYADRRGELVEAFAKRGYGLLAAKPQANSVEAGA
jgi:sugar (pentulose or hexulose) kinase